METLLFIRTANITNIIYNLHDGIVRIANHLQSCSRNDNLRANELTNIPVILIIRIVCIDLIADSSEQLNSTRMLFSECAENSYFTDHCTLQILIDLVDVDHLRPFSLAWITSRLLWTTVHESTTHIVSSMILNKELTARLDRLTDDPNDSLTILIVLIDVRVARIVQQRLCRMEVVARQAVSVVI